jgi:hypothetical protein
MTAGGMTVVASGLFLLAGVLEPAAADLLLRLFLATLAAGFVAIRGYQALLPSRMTQDFYSPFDGSDPGTTPETPQVLRTLTAQLEAADRPRAAARAPIPRGVRWELIDEARRRLAQHHRLDLRDPADHEAIRSRVSETTWLLIGSEDTTEERSDSSTPPLARLPLILDELERL